MADSNIIAGRLAFICNGKKITLEGSCEIDAWDTERETVTHADGKTGVIIKGSPMMIKSLELVVRKGFTTETLRDFTDNVNITVEDIDKKLTYYFINSMMIGKPTYKFDKAVIDGIEYSSNNVSVIHD